MKPEKNDFKLYAFLISAGYIILFVLCCHAGVVSATTGDRNFLTVIEAAFLRMVSAEFMNFLPIVPEAWQYIGSLTLIYALVVSYAVFDYQRNKHFTHGKESGDAHWNVNLADFNKRYTSPFGSPLNGGDDNMILTNDVKMSLNDRGTQRNNNVLVIGGAGTGKSRYVVKPNLLQENASYVVTDPAGEMIRAMGMPLKNAGYDIKIFNLVDMYHSNCYNPFNYIRNDEGVISLINCLIRNTTPPGQHSGDPFWEKSETALLQALIFYLIHHEKDISLQNFSTIMIMLRLAAIDQKGNPLDENRSDIKSKLDILFDNVRRDDKNSIAVKQYDTYKMAAGRTMKSILISCSVRLTVFNLQTIADLTSSDSMELDQLGDRRMALFIVTSQTDPTYNFLASMMYTQLFDALYYKAGKQETGERLKYPVRCMLDEFVNIGEIPDFTKKLATMRKYNISATVIIQNLSQLKAMYKDDWETITGNCDSLLFLGGKEWTTLQSISDMLGKATITVQNHGRSTGSKGTGNLNYNVTARNLMTPEEISVMDNSDCILFIRGESPFFGKKYIYDKHPRYKTTGDANKDYIFDYTKMPEYDCKRVENKMTQNEKDAAVSHEKGEREWNTLPNGEKFQESTDQEEVLNQIGYPDETIEKVVFSYQADLMIKKYKDNHMQNETPLVFMEGPTPTKKLPFLAKTVSKRLGAPCIIFADNSDTITLLTGFLYDPENRHTRELIERATDMVSDIEDAYGGTYFKIKRVKYNQFRSTFVSKKQRDSHAEPNPQESSS